MIFFLIFAQNKDCGYTLEPPRRGGSNEYPQSMFLSKSKKNRYTPSYPSFANIKVGFKGVYITRTCFRDVYRNAQQRAMCIYIYIVYIGDSSFFYIFFLSFRYETKSRLLNDLPLCAPTDQHVQVIPLDQHIFRLPIREQLQDRAYDSISGMYKIKT